MSTPVLPAIIDWSRHTRSLAARFQNRTAASDSLGGALRYEELIGRAHALAAHLIDKGLAPGTPVASLLPNVLDATWVGLGIKLGGFAEVALGWGYTADELAWCARLSGAKTLIAPLERTALAREAGFADLLSPEDIFSTIASTPLPAVAGDLAGRIQFTSGTTGKPKGVLTTHARRWMGEQMQKAAWPFMPAPGSKILLMTPYVHGAGLLATGWFDVGGEIVLHDGVDPHKVLGVLRKGDIAAMFAPPTVMAKLMTVLDGQALPPLQCIFTGTQPLARGLYERVRSVFGPVVRLTYGKTECINPITTLAFNEIDDAFTDPLSQTATCTGWPAPGVEISIGRPDSNETTDGQDEIWLRAPQLSEGMITTDGFAPHQPQGWHATGDLGFLDPRGRLWLTGRVADVIKTGGYRVNPDEVESTLSGMRCCTQACVTSIASDYWGEVITVAIEQARDGWREEIEQRVQSLSRHKRPRLFVEFEALPRNPQGKISRRKLREVILERYRLNDGPYPELESINRETPPAQH